MGGTAKHLCLGHSNGQQRPYTHTRNLEQCTDQYIGARFTLTTFYQVHPTLYKGTVPPSSLYFIVHKFWHRFGWQSRLHIIYWVLYQCGLFLFICVPAFQFERLQFKLAYPEQSGCLAGLIKYELITQLTASGTQSDIQSGCESQG